MLLLDTGVRASELCELKVEDCDLNNSCIKVMGKGRKERIIEFSPLTDKHIWRYLSERAERTKDDWLFTTDEGRKLGRDDLARLI